MLQSCLLERSCISFTVWGFTTSTRWFRGVFPGEGSANIYTEEFEVKAAHEALRRDLALAAGVSRRRP
jgi:endo-1,4-beta-xylanase